MKAYDRLVLKESDNIDVNQQNIEEAQRQIKKSQLAIERAERSLVDDIGAVDIRAAKRRAKVSPTILFFVSVITFFCTNHFLCVNHFFLCQPFFVC
jgi:hypothetical protein